MALAFLAGNGLLQGLPHLPTPAGGAVLLVVLAIGMALRAKAVIAAVAGFAWAWAGATSLLSHDLPVALEGRDIAVVGTIASLPELHESGPGFVLAVEDWPGRDARWLPRRLDLTWYDTSALVRPGERWQLTVRLRRRHGYANPGGMDYEAQLFREGVGATGYVRNDGDNRRLAGPGWSSWVLMVRGAIADRLAEVLPDSPHLGVIQGLAVGERQQLPVEHWRVFAATGTSHLMAISGLHIAMVAALGAMLGASLARLPGMQRRCFSAVDGRALGCMLVAVAYSALAGFGVPAQRTMIMICLYCGSRLLRRELRASQGLALSLVGVLLVDPLAPLSVGAWLSFAAVGAILVMLTGRVRPEREGRGAALREFLSLQWAVTLGLLPLAIMVFGSVLLVSPVVNLLAIPFFTWLVVPLVLAGSAALFVWAPLGSAVLAGANALLGAAWPLLAWAASLDAAVWHSPDPPLWAKALLCVGAVLVIAPGFFATRVVGLLCCLPALAWRPEPLPEGGFRLATLDVGQGLAVVVETRAHAFLYDAGPAFQGGSDTGERVVVPYLSSRAIRRLDTVMASHGDLDHVGGFRSVLPTLPVAAVLAGPSVRLPGTVLRECRKGQRWEWDGVGFEVLHPPATARFRGDNNTSCVVRITGQGGSALLLGDIEREAERSLLDEGLAGPVSVVVAAHHGSRTSSTAAFVEAVQARYVLVSAGYRNRWGFPKPEVVARWRGSGAQVFDTAASGALDVVLLPDGVVGPVAWRRQAVRYWHVDVAPPGP